MRPKWSQLPRKVDNRTASNLPYSGISYVSGVGDGKKEIYGDCRNFIETPSVKAIQPLSNSTG